MPLGPLAGLAAGYLLILLIPGPNLLLVCSAVAIGGRKGGALAATGVAAGAAFLSLVLVVTFTPLEASGSSLGAPARIAGATILLLLALAFLRQGRPAPAGAGQIQGAAGALLLASFGTAAFNPVTAAFVLAQLLGPLAGQPAAWTLVPAVIGGMALSHMLVAAMLLGLPGCRRRLLARQRAVRVAAAAALCWSAAATLLPLLAKAPAPHAGELPTVLTDEGGLWR